MRPTRLRSGKAAGFALPAAIFLITVLAAIAGVLINIASSQQASSLLSIQGARAFNAAQSGLAYAARAALAGGTCANTSFSSTAAGLLGFTVNVTCSAVTGTEGTSTYVVYSLGATATAGASATGDLVTRTLLATVTSAP